MTNLPTLPATADRTPIGVISIGKTVYQVFRLEVGENSKGAGIRHNFALEGPRGAMFFVTDHGPKYLINSVSMGTKNSKRLIAFRPLKGLTRAHLAPFGVEV